MTETETPDALNKEAIKQLRQAYDNFAFTARISPQRAEEMAWGLCQYLPALLDELERLKAENARVMDSFLIRDGQHVITPRRAESQLELARRHVNRLSDAHAAALRRALSAEAENARLKNDLCQVHTVNPCDDCQRGYRLRDMETISGKRLCIHCLKAHAEQMVECMVAASPYDEGAVASAEYGIGEALP